MLFWLQSNIAWWYQDDQCISNLRESLREAWDINKHVFFSFTSPFLKQFRGSKVVLFLFLIFLKRQFSFLNLLLKYAPCIFCEGSPMWYNSDYVLLHVGSNEIPFQTEQAQRAIEYLGQRRVTFQPSWPLLSNPWNFLNNWGSIFLHMRYSILNRAILREAAFKPRITWITALSFLGNKQHYVHLNKVFLAYSKDNASILSETIV